jgi:NitT/TauT family transport system substrate-binding protein
MAVAQLALGLPARAQAQKLSTLRVGSTAGDSYAEPFYADERGFFKSAGLDVDVNVFPTGAAVTFALAGNAIDVGITNPISLANAVEHGLPFQFFASAATYNPLEVALLVAADSPIKEAKDLNGKTVATTALKDTNSLHIVAWVDANGGDSKSIKLVEVPFSAMAAAVRRGTVAAAPIAEPALTTAIKAGGLRILSHPMDVYGKHFMVGGYFARADVIAANLSLLRRFRDAVYATGAWANSHPDETAVILAKYSKMDPETVRSMNRAPYGNALTPEMLQPYLDFAFKYGYVGKQFKASDLIAKL